MVAWIILNISDATKNIIAIISNAPGITDGSLRLNWLFIVAIIISVQPIIFIIIDTNSNILISCAPGYISIVSSIETNGDIGNRDEDEEDNAVRGVRNGANGQNAR